ncbi:Cytochrome P450 monooxygenase [Sphaerulina musiva]
MHLEPCLDYLRAMTGIFPFVFLVVLSVTLFACATTILLSEYSAQKQFWNSRLWSGPRRTTVLAGLSGKIDFLFNTRSLVHNGYNKVEIHRASSLALVRKSDDKVDLPLVAEFSTAARYTGDQYIVRNPRHVDLVKQQLTRKLPSLTASIAEELALGFNDEWKGEATRWSTVPLFSTCTKIVSRSANRVFCRTELCRNPEFLDRSRRYTQAVFGAAAVINLFPAWGKLLVSQIVTLPMWMHLKACNRIAAPVIKQRLQAISGRVGETHSKPNDAMQ